MGNVIKIEWDDYPAPKPRPRGLTARPEFEAVRALKVGEAIKFPCTWKHSIRWGKYDICNGRAGAMGADRKDAPYKKFQTACIDKVIYVRRLKDNQGFHHIGGDLYVAREEK